MPIEIQAPAPIRTEGTAGSWRDIANSDEYNSLDVTSKALKAKDYIDTVVRPKLEASGKNWDEVKDDIATRIMPLDIVYKTNHFKKLSETEQKEAIRKNLYTSGKLSDEDFNTSGGITTGDGKPVAGTSRGAGVVDEEYRKYYTSPESQQARADIIKESAKAQVTGLPAKAEAIGESLGLTDSKEYRTQAAAESKALKDKIMTTPGGATSNVIGSVAGGLPVAAGGVAASFSGLPGWAAGILSGIAGNFLRKPEDANITGGQVVKNAAVEGAFGAAVPGGAQVGAEFGPAVKEGVSKTLKGASARFGGTPDLTQEVAGDIGRQMVKRSGAKTPEAISEFAAKEKDVLTNALALKQKADANIVYESARKSRAGTEAAIAKADAELKAELKNIDDTYNDPIEALSEKVKEASNRLQAMKNAKLEVDKTPESFVQAGTDKGAVAEQVAGAVTEHVKGIRKSIDEMFQQAYSAPNSVGSKYQLTKGEITPVLSKLSEVENPSALKSIAKGGAIDDAKNMYSLSDLYDLRRRIRDQADAFWTAQRKSGSVEDFNTAKALSEASDLLNNVEEQFVNNIAIDADREALKKPLAAYKQFRQDLLDVPYAGSSRQSPISEIEYGAKMRSGSADDVLTFLKGTDATRNVENLAKAAPKQTANLIRADLVSKYEGDPAKIIDAITKDGGSHYYAFKGLPQAEQAAILQDIKSAQSTGESLIKAAQRGKLIDTSRMEKLIFATDAEKNELVRLKQEAVDTATAKRATQPTTISNVEKLFGGEYGTGSVDSEKILKNPHLIGEVSRKWGKNSAEKASVAQTVVADFTDGVLGNNSSKLTMFTDPANKAGLVELFGPKYAEDMTYMAKSISDDLKIGAGGVAGGDTAGSAAKEAAVGFSYIGGWGPSTNRFARILTEGYTHAYGKAALEAFDNPTALAELLDMAEKNAIARVGRKAAGQAAGRAGASSVAPIMTLYEALKNRADNESQKNEKTTKLPKAFTNPKGE